MKLRFIVLALCAALLTACATTSTTSPSLRKRLAPEWIASAQHVESGGRTIYYRGKARGAATGTAVKWSGTVTGEVLVLAPTMAIVIPSGTVTLTSSGELKVSGQHQAVTSDSPAWKDLLRP
jgi:type IV pilus biogenesis protein CpaD/CtpE